MTQAEVILRAVDFVKANNLPVEHISMGVRFFEADTFNEFFESHLYDNNFWIIDFHKRLPPGIDCVFPSSIMISVDDVSGRVFEQKFWPGPFQSTNKKERFPRGE